MIIDFFFIFITIYFITLFLFYYYNFFNYVKATGYDSLRTQKIYSLT